MHHLEVRKLGLDGLEEGVDLKYDLGPLLSQHELIGYETLDRRGQVGEKLNEFRNDLVSRRAG